MSFQFNPDPTVRTIEVTAAGITLIPQMPWPEQVCVEDFSNVDLTGDVTPGANARPVVWDPDTCQMVAGSWPCSTVVDWDPLLSAEPDTVSIVGGPGCVDCDEHIAYRNQVTGRITHWCIGGQIVAAGFVPSAADVETVRYSLNAITFPQTFGGVGGGSWPVYGADRMNEPCVAGGTEEQYAGPDTIVEWACHGDGGSATAPAAGWNSLTWAPYAGFNGNPNRIRNIADGSNGYPCQYPAFRVNPEFPTGAGGPFAWSLGVTTSPTSVLQFAAYDVVTGQYLDPTIVTSSVAGTLEVRTGNLGSWVYSFGLETGIRVEFDPASVPGLDAANVRFVAWSVGNPAAIEELFIYGTFAFPPGGSCCNQWANVAEVAAWLNANDPNGPIWTVDGSTVVATVTTGVGAAYGDLATCDGVVFPTVTVT